MVVRSRAARVLTEIAKLPDTHVAVFTHRIFLVALKSEVLGLSQHACANPSCGNASATEILLIETASGERYWELAELQEVVIFPASGVERIPLAS